MTPKQLKAWMDSLGFNKVRASTEIGISRQSLYDYLSGKKPIPRVVALACEALSLRWEKFK